MHNTKCKTVKNDFLDRKTWIKIAKKKPLTCGIKELEEHEEPDTGRLTSDMKLDHNSSALFFSFSFFLFSSSMAICSASSFLLLASSSFSSFAASVIPDEGPSPFFSSSFIPPLRFLWNIFIKMWHNNKKCDQNNEKRNTNNQHYHFHAPKTLVTCVYN